MNCTKLNSLNLRLTTKNQSLLGSSFLNIQNYGCSNCTTTLFTKFGDVNKFKELEMDTDSVYLPLAQTELEGCIWPESRAEWKQMRSKDCTYSFTADAAENFSPRSCCGKHNKKT